MDQIPQQNLGEMGFSIDRNGIILSIGEEILALSGYSKDEVIGQNFRAFVYLDDQKGLWLSFQKDLEGILEPFEFRLLKKDGSNILVKTFSQPIKENGIVVRIDGIMTKL